MTPIYMYMFKKVFQLGKLYCFILKEQPHDAPEIYTESQIWNPLTHSHGSINNILIQNV